MNISDFDYNLPKSIISQSPEKRRENARLLVINKGKIEHKHFYNIIDYLNPGDVLVLNETGVKPCRIEGKKITGAKVQVIVETLAGKSYGRNSYICRVKGHSKKGNLMIFNKSLTGRVIDRFGDFSVIRFNKKPSQLMLAYPFYVTNKNINPRYYQTVFAKKQAESLAAPTAGLHFSASLLKSLEKKGVKIAKVCLHIGFGTFIPIRNLKSHKMQPEFMEISKSAAQTINKRRGRLFCVGTTVVKALETASDKDGIIHPFRGNSTLFITPDYKLKTKIDGLITNFHMPKSSLLLLVSSFYDRKKLLAAYKVAIKNNYRFLSFGDAMMIIR